MTRSISRRRLILVWFVALSSALLSLPLAIAWRNWGPQLDAPVINQPRVIIPQSPQALEAAIESETIASSKLRRRDQKARKTKLPPRAPASG